MLSYLTIENFALIERLSLELCGQLNVLTGETGAGKSIVIDALRYVLGDRFTSTQIRDAGLPCLVEAVFDLVSKDIRGNNKIFIGIKGFSGTDHSIPPSGLGKITFMKTGGMGVAG